MFCGASTFDIFIFGLFQVFRWKILIMMFSQRTYINQIVISELFFVVLKLFVFKADESYTQVEVGPRPFLL
jgi:hypothetical protein